jgi:hypothetical protein
MIAYTMFPVLVLAAAIARGVICAWSMDRFFSLWAVASVALGIGGLFVPWHTASGLHRGSGSPVPMVIWERMGNGSYIDFPNPLAFLINPLAVFALGSVCWLIALFIRKLATSRDERRHGQPAAPS